jgi:hypothetical protein
MADGGGGAEAAEVRAGRDEGMKYVAVSGIAE